MPKLQAMVLGCNGQLGHELVRQLGEQAIPKPHEVLNVTNFAAVKELIQHVRPTVLVNATGICSPTLCERDKIQAWKVNAEAVDNIVKVCALTGTPYMHISCDQVFGSDGGNTRPYTETAPVGPTNYYGHTKLCAENAVLRIGQCMCPEYWKKGFQYWIIRTSMLYERPWRQSQNWIYQMLRFGTSRRDSALSLPSDIYRSPTYAPHLAEAIVWMLKHHKEMVSGIYNIVNPGAPSLYEIGCCLSMSSKMGINIEISDRDSYAKTHGREPTTMPKYTALDGSKFSDISPIKLPSWQSALEEFALAWEE